MPITGTKLWADSTVLYAADMNQYLMRGVKVYADATTRDAAYGVGKPTLEEGEICYLISTKQTLAYNGTSWVQVGATPVIRQVVSVTSTTTFTTASTTYVDVTGLSASITPSSATNKILVLLDIQGDGGQATGDTQSALQLVRGSTAIAVGAAAGNRWLATGSLSLPQAYDRNTQLQSVISMSSHILDSPATTASTTYKVQGRISAGTLAVNRTVTDTDLAGYVRTASSITLIEVTA